MAGARGERTCEASTKSLTTDLTTTPEISISRFAAGTVYIPVGSTITTLTFYAAYSTGGVYFAAYGSTGTALTLAVAANGAYQLPAALFGAGQIKIVADAAGDVELSLKS